MCTTDLLHCRRRHDVLAMKDTKTIVFHSSSSSSSLRIKMTLLIVRESLSIYVSVNVERDEYRVLVYVPH